MVEKRKRWVKTFSDAPDPAVQYFVKSIPLNLKVLTSKPVFKKWLLCLLWVWLAFNNTVRVPLKRKSELIQIGQNGNYLIYKLEQEHTPLQGFDTFFKHFKYPIEKWKPGLSTFWVNFVLFVQES